MKASVSVPAITIKVGSGEMFNYINPKAYIKGLYVSSGEWNWKQYDDLTFIEYLRAEANECSGFIFVKNGRWIAFKDIVEVMIEQDKEKYSYALLIEDAESVEFPRNFSLKKKD